VHITEKVLKGGNFKDSEGLIEVTPVIGTKQDQAYRQEVLPFNIRQELVITSSKSKERERVQRETDLYC
jgi:hypothetical protein